MNKLFRKRTLFLITLTYLFLNQACNNSGQNKSSKNISIENDFISVKISPMGAELQSIVNKKTGTEYLWQGDTAYWASRSPVMFPIAVRIRDDKFTWKGKTYEMPRVGLARIYQFKVLPSGKPGIAVFEMASDEHTLPFYPFMFRFEVTYMLDKNSLIVQYVVENKGKDTLYFAAGGHPGINCPVNTGHKRGDYQYTFSEKLNIKYHKIANGLVMPLQIQLLESENSLALDDQRIPADGTGMLVTNMPSRQIGVGLLNEPPFVTVDLGDFPNVNLWAPPGKPFVCIEPMVAHHDFADSPAAIEKKPHYIALAAGESRTYHFTIIINQ
jgi:galactose mutarotase-like enzyme